MKHQKDCYCFEKIGDNARCPEHGVQAHVVNGFKVVSWAGAVALLLIIVLVVLLGGAR